MSQVPLGSQPQASQGATAEFLVTINTQPQASQGAPAAELQQGIQGSQQVQPSQPVYASQAEHVAFSQGEVPAGTQTGTQQEVPTGPLGAAAGMTHAPAQHLPTGPTPTEVPGAGEAAATLQAGQEAPAVVSVRVLEPGATVKGVETQPVSAAEAAEAAVPAEVL